MVRDTLALGIGDRIKVLRGRHQITQRELAKMLSVSPGYLSDVENRKNRANAEVLIGLVLHFPALNPDWLLTGRGQMDIAATPSNQIERYSLDFDAVWAARQLFYKELHKKNDKDTDIARFLSNEAYFFSWVYRTYMTHFDSLIAAGVPESEARERAWRECERSDEQD